MPKNNTSSDSAVWIATGFLSQSLVIPRLVIRSSGLKNLLKSHWIVILNGFA